LLVIEPGPDSAIGAAKPLPSWETSTTYIFASAFSRERAQPLFWRQACLSVAGCGRAFTAMDALYAMKRVVSPTR